MISSLVVQHIEIKLSYMIETGKRIENITLKVSPESEIAEYPAIETRFGILLIEPGEYIPKGYAYLIEKPLSHGGIGFIWVGKKKSSPASDGDRQPAS